MERWHPTTGNVWPLEAKAVLGEPHAPALEGTVTVPSEKVSQPLLPLHTITILIPIPIPFTISITITIPISIQVANTFTMTTAITVTVTVKIILAGSIAVITIVVVLVAVGVCVGVSDDGGVVMPRPLNPLINRKPQINLRFTTVPLSIFTHQGSDYDCRHKLQNQTCGTSCCCDIYFRFGKDLGPYLRAIRNGKENWRRSTGS